MNKNKKNLRMRSLHLSGEGKDLWVVKVYFVVGIGLNMVTYFRGVTDLMFF